MEEMGIEPIVSCTPNQHSPTNSAASGSERGDLMEPRSLPLAVLTRIQRATRRPTIVVETSRVFHRRSPNGIRPQCDSIEERHITPARRQMFSVHQHAMPTAEN